MSHTTMTSLLFATVTTLAALSSAAATSYPTAAPVDTCATPPVAAGFDVATYTGTWFQIYGAGTGLTFGGGRCVTANYTLRADGVVDVLNCDADPASNRPTCVRAKASQRNGTTNPAQLQVAFPGVPMSPFNPGSYNVAALIGNKKFGYLAAAVYSCSPPEAGSQEGYFILARTVRYSKLLLYILKRRLTAAGYDVSDVDFVKTDQEDCHYFFDGDFTVRGE